MEMLKIEEIEFPNKEGKLLSIKEEIEVDGSKKEVELYPFTSDEFEKVLKTINSNEDDGGKFIDSTLIEKIVKPEINEKNIKFVKPMLKAKLLKAVLKATGLDSDQIKETKISSEDESSKKNIK